MDRLQRNDRIQKRENGVDGLAIPLSSKKSAGWKFFIGLSVARFLAMEWFSNRQISASFPKLSLLKGWLASSRIKIMEKYLEQSWSSALMVWPGSSQSVSSMGSKTARLAKKRTRVIPRMRDDWSCRIKWKTSGKFQDWRETSSGEKWRE